MFKKDNKGKDKKEGADEGAKGGGPNFAVKLKKRTPSEREQRKKAAYVADFDRNQTFDLNIDSSEKRPFNSVFFGLIVKKGFTKLYNSQELSDITLVLGDEKVPAHKTVLCVWSDTFRAMLDSASAWKESTMEELVVDVEPDGYECFKLMLQYMYTGDASFINDQNVFNLISLTNYYGIHSLKELCGELLGAIVDGDNLFCLLDLSENFDVNSLRSACCEHLAQNFGELLDGDKLAELKPAAWVEMLNDDDLQIKSEVQVYEAVIRYADQHTDKAERDTILTTILPCVRFPCIAPNYLIDEIEGQESIKHLPIVRDLIYEALKYKLYPKSIPIDCPRIKARCGFRFDPAQCHNALTLSEEGTKASVTGSAGWVNVRTIEPFSHYQNYIEFKIIGSGNYMLGLVSGPIISLNSYAGQYSNGWSYYSPGQLYHNNATPYTGQNYTIGDKIGVAIDFENNSFLFYKNDALSITVPSMQSAISQSCYPIACMSSVGECVQIVQGAPGPAGLMTKKKKK